jgi:hypothetical protein
VLLRVQFPIVLLSVSLSIKIFTLLGGRCIFLCCSHNILLIPPLLLFSFSFVPFVVMVSFVCLLAASARLPQGIVFEYWPH